MFAAKLAPVPPAVHLPRELTCRDLVGLRSRTQRLKRQMHALGPCRVGELGEEVGDHRPEIGGVWREYFTGHRGSGPLSARGQVSLYPQSRCTPARRCRSGGPTCGAASATAAT